MILWFCGCVSELMFGLICVCPLDIGNADTRYDGRISVFPADYER